MLEVERVPDRTGAIHDHTLCPTPEQISAALEAAGMPATPDLYRFGMDALGRVGVDAAFEKATMPELANYDTDTTLLCGISICAPLSGCRNFATEIADWTEVWCAPDTSTPLPQMVLRTLEALPDCKPLQILHFFHEEGGHRWVIELSPLSGSSSPRYADVQICRCS